MAAAANPLAAAAGKEILAAGGSAVDTAIAVQMILNLVEPQSSGIGGGAFLVYWNKQAGKAKPAEPPMRKTFLFAPSDGIEHGTSHVAIVDCDGNAVSMTTTIEDGFGSRLMTKSGFLLNNELTDFNFAPTEEVKVGEQNSGIQAIVVTSEGFTGGADSRREGVAVGN